MLRPFYNASNSTFEGNLQLILKQHLSRRRRLRPCATTQPHTILNEARSEWGVENNPGFPLGYRLL